MMKWTQHGRTLKLKTKVGTRHVTMPHGWQLDKVHPTCLAVAEWLLAVNLPAMKDEYPTIGEIMAMPRRMPGGPTNLLSYSGGADSTAALMLLDGTDTIPVYLKRDYRTYQRADGETVDLGTQDAIDEYIAKHDALVIPNDLELLRIDAGLPHGFAHGYGYAAVLVLLADFYDAGAISFGSIMDTVWFGSGMNPSPRGSRFVDIISRDSGVWNTTARLLDRAGIFASMPVGGCSEVITTRLASDAISCPSSYGSGKPCGRCFKCFRKEQILGRPVEVKGRVRNVLTKRPLKMATSTLRGCQIADHYPDELEEFRGVDAEWTERHWDHSLDVMCRRDLAIAVRGNLASYGIDPMTDDDIERMKAFLKE